VMTMCRERFPEDAYLCCRVCMGNRIEFYDKFFGARDVGLLMELKPAEFTINGA